ncbi:hypothetical protein ACOME3_006858 [Neoechinorhynchus agilis]
MNRRRGYKLSGSIVRLQSLARIDPQAYRDDYTSQLASVQCQINPNSIKAIEYSDSLAESLLFVCQLSALYPDISSNLCHILICVLKEGQMDRKVRMLIVKSIFILQRKHLFSDTSEVYTLLLGLCREEDRQLRKAIQGFVIGDVAALNQKHRNKTLNNQLQRLVGNFLNSDEYPQKVNSAALEILISLYKKQVWSDEHTLNIIASQCLSSLTKISVKAVQFMLGNLGKDNEYSKDSDEEEDDDLNVKNILLGHRVGKKTKGRRKKKEKLMQTLKRKRDRLKKDKFDINKLYQIRDPQGFTERLYKALVNSRECYQVKLLFQELISKLISIHQLIIISFYPFLERYLFPKQEDVTRIIMFSAEATHHLVPPDVVSQLITTIANNFVSDRNSVQAMTVGLNAIREICERCPHGITEVIAEDVLQYIGYKDRSVSIAAKSLVNTLKTVNPSTVPKKYRSRPTEKNQYKKKVVFGDVGVVDIVPGAEALVTALNTEDDERDDLLDVSSNDDEVVIETDEDVHSKAKRLLGSRLLTSEELTLIKAEQIMEESGVKRGRQSISDSKCFVDGDDIYKYVKKTKRSREEILAELEEHRANRPKFRRKPKKAKCSTTNKEKNKSKAFAMMKHKYKTKKNRSFQERQRCLQAALNKRKKLK